MNVPTTWLAREDLRALASLTDSQRHAVRMALYEWQEVAEAEGCGVRATWRGFGAEVGHSAALRRLLSGSALFVDRPPLTAGSYPDYARMRAAKAPRRILSRKDSQPFLGDRRGPWRLHVSWLSAWEVRRPIALVLSLGPFDLGFSATRLLGDVYVQFYLLARGFEVAVVREAAA